MGTLRVGGTQALEGAINLGAVRVGNLGPVTNLFVRDGLDAAPMLQKDLQQRLTGVSVYRRAELPTRFAYGHNPRVGDLVLVADEGVSIAISPDASPPAGLHGWDPAVESMRGLFLARGPGIRPGSRIPAFEAVHIYPWLARMLGLRVPNGIDGDASVLTEAIGPLP